MSASTYNATAVIGPGGKLEIEHVPFQQGERVNVTLTPLSADKQLIEQFPLRGSVIYYDAPFEPAVPPEDWEALS